ncbi:unnamed protein product, partial [Polarella glacialis]
LLLLLLLLLFVVVVIVVIVVVVVVALSAVLPAMGCSSSSNAYADPADSKGADSKGAGAAKASNTSASSSQRPELPGDELALDVSDIVVIEQSRRELPAKGTPSNSSNSNSHSNQNSNNKKKHRQLLNAIQYVGALTIPETQDIIPQATPVDSSEDISFSGRTFHSMSFEPRSSDCSAAAESWRRCGIQFEFAQIHREKLRKSRILAR